MLAEAHDIANVPDDAILTAKPFRGPLKQVSGAAPIQVWPRYDSLRL